MLFAESRDGVEVGVGDRKGEKPCAQTGRFTQFTLNFNLT